MFGSTLQSKVLDSLRRVHMPDGTDEVLASLREAKDSGQDYLRTLAGNVRDQSYRATRTVGDMEGTAGRVSCPCGRRGVRGGLARSPHARSRGCSPRAAHDDALAR